MKVETNLETINLIGQQKEKENWKFRSYLKNLDIRTNQLDKIVHKINDEVTSQIDCTKCANCCKVNYPVLDEKDIAKFSSSQNGSIREFKSAYLLISKEEKGKYNFNSMPCPFLKDNKCTNYTNRPKDCESYPHLYKDKFITRLMGVIEYYPICPIVFNVYERLKKDLWRKDWRKSIR
jgi:Fe-S-cluster containining protein